VPKTKRVQTTCSIDATGFWQKQQQTHIPDIRLPVVSAFPPLRTCFEQALTSAHPLSNATVANSKHAIFH